MRFGLLCFGEIVRAACLFLRSALLSVFLRGGRGIRTAGWGIGALGEGGGLILVLLNYLDNGEFFCVYINWLFYCSAKFMYYSRRN